MRKVLKKIKKDSDKKRLRRRLATRKKIVGTAERPRICALKTNKHLVVQVVDDAASKTLFSVQTYGKNAVKNAGNNKEGAKLVGQELAKKMKAKNVNVAVFDRAGLAYTGVIASLADSIRENGIKI